MPSLNIDSAIAAHRSWCRQLKYVVNEIADGKLDPNRLLDDTVCVLGGWLYGNGGKYYAEREAFQRLLQFHKDFHKVASQVATLSNEGKRDEANSLITSTLEPLAHNVVQLLEQLKT